MVEQTQFLQTFQVPGESSCGVNATNVDQKLAAHYIYCHCYYINSIQHFHSNMNSLIRREIAVIMYWWFLLVFLLLYHTSVAVSIVQGCGVVSSSVRCDGADAQQAPSTFRASPRHRVADAAIRQPARGAAVQAGLPGQIHLPHCGQLPPEGHAAV